MCLDMLFYNLHRTAVVGETDEDQEDVTVRPAGACHLERIICDLQAGN